MKKALLLAAAVCFGCAGLAGAESDYNVIYHFGGPPADGTDPYGSLVSDGSTLYGMTSSGGLYTYFGTVFSINTDGTGISVLHDFAGPPDGVWPHDSLLSDGSTLYGMTFGGGNSGYCGYWYGCGTLFSIQTDGTGYTILHDFPSTPFGGFKPNGTPVRVGDRLYGTAGTGGTHLCGQENCGTLFSVKPDGSDYTVIHEFSGTPDDGSEPPGSLFWDGNRLYGMTSFGGSGSCSYGCGTVFSLKPDGSDYTVLYSFTGPPDDGWGSVGTPVGDGSRLYGMTYYGGADNSGVVFSLNPDGSNYTVLHEFGGYPSDGGNPNGSLLLCGDTLYGTTTNGGANGLGVLFSLKTDGWGYTLLHQFSGYPADGSTPYGGPAAAGDSIFGMTSRGGSSQAGVIYSYALPTPTPTPDPSRVTLYVEPAAASAGDKVRARGCVPPVTPDYPADAYLLVQMPSGAIWSVLRGGGSAKGIAPYLAGITTLPAGWCGVLDTRTIRDGAAPGYYTVGLIMMPAGEPVSLKGATGFDLEGIRIE